MDMEIKTKGERKLVLKDGNMYEYYLYQLLDKSDPTLREVSSPFNFENPPMSPGILATSLAETMSQFGGIGLSAIQIGIPYRVFSLALMEGYTGKESKTDVVVLFNPKIVVESGITIKNKEGCLSFPGLFLDIERADSVDVEYQMADGKKVVGRFNGIDARCVLHEMEHLDGKLFIDKFKPLALKMAKKKSKKMLKRMSLTYYDKKA